MYNPKRINRSQMAKTGHDIGSTHGEISRHGVHSLPNRDTLHFFRHTVTTLELTTLSLYRIVRIVESLNCNSTYC